MGSFNEEDDRRAARIDAASIRDAALELGRAPEVDAVFVSCTSLRLVEAVGAIEAELGKPVTSSNHALAWHCLRLAGIADRRPSSGGCSSGHEHHPRQPAAPPLVAARRRLPGLPALLPGQRRRRHRRPAGHRCAARLSRVARRRRASGSRRSTPRRWPTSATTSPTTATSTRCSARSPTSTRCSPRRTRRGLQADPRLRAQPHLRPAPLVPRVALVARQPEARLVHLARPGAGRRAAEQLARALRRQRLGAGTRRPASTTTTRS